MKDRHEQKDRQAEGIAPSGGSPKTRLFISRSETSTGSLAEPADWNNKT